MNAITKINPQTGSDDRFFESLPLIERFVDLTSPENYRPVPHDWVVLITDIEASRQEIDRGNYKTVNMVGASIIAAVRNIPGIVDFPFVFGGDGATLALPGRFAQAALDAAASVRSWAEAEFGMSLRAGLARVAEIRAAGLDFRVAKHAASNAVSYAAFSGGGARWLEHRVKSGAASVSVTGRETPPNLTGLSCRWSNLKAENGNIVSLVLEPSENASAADFENVAEVVPKKAYGTPGSPSPVPQSGLTVQFPPPGMDIEAHASRAGKSFVRRYAELVVVNLIAWSLFAIGRPVVGFDPKEYARQTGRNTDHRKFEDGLKITLDCDDATVIWMRDFLSPLKAEGSIRFGLVVQSEALMTCIVPSPFEDDHIHFVDGANGGYAAAASML